MAKNHQPVQTKPQGVHIPNYIEHDSTILINSNRKPNHWPTIILCVIFVLTGQSVAKLLENFHYDHTEKRQNDGVWTRPLLQTVGFPLLLIPFLITKKHNNQQHAITSDGSSTRYIISLSGCIGSLLAGQGRLFSKSKLTLTYTTQLFSTLIFTFFINKIRFNRWIFISFIFAFATGALSFDREAEENHAKGASAAMFSGVYFSLLLCIIQSVFKRNESTISKPSFASVFEILIFSSLFATIITLVGLLVYGEQEDLKRGMNGFLKGKGSYVMTMVCQAVSWQVYWVGIVGLVFSVSSVLSNVVSVVTWPIVSVLVVILFSFKDYEFDVFNGIALITGALSVVAYFYRLHIENRTSLVMAN